MSCMHVKPAACGATDWAARWPWSLCQPACPIREPCVSESATPSVANSPSAPIASSATITISPTASEFGPAGTAAIKDGKVCLAPKSAAYTIEFPSGCSSINFEINSDNKSNLASRTHSASKTLRI